MEDIKKKITKLVEKIYENSNAPRKERAFPVVGILWIEGTSIMNVEINRKSKTGIGNHRFHAESLLIEDIQKEKIKNKEINAIIVLPPCNICFKKIIETKNNWKIFYLTDAVRNKMEKKYHKNSNIEFQKLENKRNYDFATKIFINYLIYKVNYVASKHLWLNKKNKLSMKTEIDKQLKEVKELIKKINKNENGDLSKKIQEYFVSKLDKLNLK